MICLHLPLCVLSLPLCLPPSVVIHQPVCGGFLQLVTVCYIGSLLSGVLCGKQLHLLNHMYHNKGLYVPHKNREVSPRAARKEIP